MSKNKKEHYQRFIDYIPAELRENKTWIVAYSVKNPITQKLEFRRNRVRPLKSKKLRRELGKTMVENINELLKKDHTSFFEAKDTKRFTLLNDAVKTYLIQHEREVLDKNLSIDTLKTYTSKIGQILKYIEYIGIDEMYCHDLNNDFITEHLDYLRYEKNVQPRTRDNYYTFYVTLTTWLKKKKYIVDNPCDGLSRINRKKTEKAVIPKRVRKLIFNYYEDTNLNFLVFCMCCYYCLIRRTELSKLKVENINLKNRTIFVSAEDAKMNKSGHVTIPEHLTELLVNHIKKANNSDYLFSVDNYAPGPLRFKPNKATNNWRRMRKKIKIDSSIKWYHLKDTGIVDLILKGVNLKSVRDQARHHNISQTNDYIPKNMKKSDEFILNSGIDFIE